MTLLSDRLERLLAETDGPARLQGDPIRFAHRYERRPDIEVAAYIAAGLAFGRVSAFGPVIDTLLTRSDGFGGPAQWVRDFDVERESQALGALYYRWIRGPDLVKWLAGLSQTLQRVPDLGAPLRLEEGESEIGPALSRWVHTLRGDIGWDAPSRGLRYLLPDPAKGSAAKRLNMLMRWMVRPPTDGIDFGFWSHIPLTALVMPVDTHVHRIATMVGLTRRKTANWRTAVELTRALAAFDSTDPVKYDFALAHLGISGGCTGGFVSEVCGACALRTVCVVGVKGTA